MDDLARKVAFIEARLTLLERLIFKQSNEISNSPQEMPLGHMVKFSCDDPSLFISNKYSNEYDESNSEFCWIGSEGPIQIVFPIASAQRMRCTLRMVPHPRVDIQRVRMIVNDEEVPHSAVSANDVIEINFEVPASKNSKISLILADLDSVRPSQFGENDDERLLAARFFGADFTVL